MQTPSLDCHALRPHKDGFGLLQSTPHGEAMDE